MKYFKGDVPTDEISASIQIIYTVISKLDNQKGWKEAFAHAMKATHICIVEGNIR